MATTGLSEKQQAQRATGLGASEVPIALGLSPFTSPAELAAVKRGEMPPFQGNEFTHWGQRLERSIAEEWLEEHRESGEDVSIFTPPTLRHPKCEVLLASADRVIVPEGRRARELWKGLLEVKNVSAWKKDLFGEADDAIPEAFLVQVQTQFEVLDLEDGWIATLIGGNEYREYRQRRDREMGGQVVAFTQQWWANHVVQGLPVKLDGSDAAASYIKRRFPKETTPPLPSTPELAELVQALRLAKAALKETEVAESELDHQLRAAIGEAAGIEGLCTFRANKPSQKTDWEALARQLYADLGLTWPKNAQTPPRSLDEIIAAFTTTKPGARVLRLTKG